LKWMARITNTPAS